MKQVKILRIITRLNIGGPAQHTLLLTRDMQGELFQTQLITGSCAKGEGDMSYLAEELGVRPIVVKEMSREINFVEDLQRIKRVISARRRLINGRTEKRKNKFLGSSVF